ncbi:hypothetical protein ACFL3E_02385 [Patescibacteria group bacterium]
MARKFSRSRKFIVSNIKDVPENKTIIYKLLNNSGTNLYTGIAGRARGQDRLLEHKKFKKDKIPGATKFSFAQVKNKKIAEDVEKRIIKNEQPKFNEQNK